ncbi:predicted protein [Chaetoceros tenuissimus]|uniref:Uncharacterized protein n=1 Tax=Chaetoceros tenuissimus TaxID=426638 RepID=A0AAD3HC33_9STRA|nr:predicted protein [Chaetoceros tenuissimus]
MRISILSLVLALSLGAIEVSATTKIDSINSKKTELKGTPISSLKQDRDLYVNPCTGSISRDSNDDDTTGPCITDEPTNIPSSSPSISPTSTPSVSSRPTSSTAPSLIPSSSPTSIPTVSPTFAPSSKPSGSGYKSSCPGLSPGLGVTDDNVINVVFYYAMETDNTPTTDDANALLPAVEDLIAEKVADDLLAHCQNDVDTESDRRNLRRLEAVALAADPADEILEDTPCTPEDPNNQCYVVKGQMYVRVDASDSFGQVDQDVKITTKEIMSSSNLAVGNVKKISYVDNVSPVVKSGGEVSIGGADENKADSSKNIDISNIIIIGSACVAAAVLLGMGIIKRRSKDENDDESEGGNLFGDVSYETVSFPGINARDFDKSLNNDHRDHAALADKLDSIEEENESVYAESSCEISDSTNTDDDELEDIPIV